MPDDTDENSSFIEEELETLKSIYINEIIVDSLKPVKLSIDLHPATADNVDEQYVRMSLFFILSDKYPDEIPEIIIRNPRGLSDEKIDEIKQDLNSIAENKKGNSMLFEIIEAAKEHLTIDNRPSGSCAICLFGFSEDDVFTRTECYHYFHSHCLARYAKHLLATEEKEKENDTNPSSFKLLCPMCRIPISFQGTEEDYPPPSAEENAFALNEEIADIQKRMANIYQKQIEQGGIIDVEAERNKFLLEISNVPTQSSNNEKLSSKQNYANSNSSNSQKSNIDESIKVPCSLEQNKKDEKSLKDEKSPSSQNETQKHTKKYNTSNYDRNFDGRRNFKYNQSYNWQNQMSYKDYPKNSSRSKNYANKPSKHFQTRNADSATFANNEKDESESLETIDNNLSRSENIDDDNVSHNSSRPKYHSSFNDRKYKSTSNYYHNPSYNMDSSRHNYNRRYYQHKQQPYREKFSYQHNRRHNIQEHDYKKDNRADNFENKIQDDKTITQKEDSISSLKDYKSDQKQSSKKETNEPRYQRTKSDGEIEELEENNYKSRNSPLEMQNDDDKNSSKDIQNNKETNFAARGNNKHYSNRNAYVPQKHYQNFSKDDYDTSYKSQKPIHSDKRNIEFKENNAKAIDKDNFSKSSNNSYHKDNRYLKNNRNISAYNNQKSNIGRTKSNYRNYDRDNRDNRSRNGYYIRDSNSQKHYSKNVDYSEDKDHHSDETKLDSCDCSSGNDKNEHNSNSHSKISESVNTILKANEELDVSLPKAHNTNLSLDSAQNITTLLSENQDLNDSNLANLSQINYEIPKNMKFEDSLWNLPVILPNSAVRPPPGFADPLKKVIYGFQGANPPPGFQR